MRSITLTAFYIFLTLDVSAQSVNDDKSFFDYSYDKTLVKKNKVETITIDQYSGNKIYSTTKYYFDKEGLLLKQISFDTTGAIKGTYDFIADAHQQLTSYKHTDNELHKTYPPVIYFKSYSDDRLVKDSSSEMPVSYVYTYDTSGHLTSTFIFANFGNAGTKRLITYLPDNYGKPKNITEKVWQMNGDTAGVKYSDRDIAYNKNGKIEKETEKVNTENLLVPINAGTITYRYDGFGNLLQISRTNAASCTYTYNVKGLIISEHMSLVLKKDALQPETERVESTDKYTYTYWK